MIRHPIYQYFYFIAEQPKMSYTEFAFNEISNTLNY